MTDQPGTPLSMSELGGFGSWRIAGTDGLAFSIDTISGMGHSVVPHASGAMERAADVEPVQGSSFSGVDLDTSKWENGKPPEAEPSEPATGSVIRPELLEPKF